MKLKVGLAACVLAGVGISSASASTFSGMVNFGDSLSDVGNIYALTTIGHMINSSTPIVPGAPGYYDGRFSNGPIWIDQLAGLLGLPAPTISANGGSDYAYGDATSGTGFTQTYIPNIQQQISSWSSNSAGAASQLFTMFGGANDLFDALSSGGTPAQQATDAQQAAMNIATGVQTLYNDGARHILVANLPDLGLLPDFRGSPQETQAAALADTFNSTLATQLTQISGSSPGLILYSLDVHTLFNQLVADPSAYGLTNVTDRAYTGDDNFIGNGTSVADPSGYLFWDADHPTTTGHELLAQAAYDVVPEPSSMMGVLGALVLVVGRRRSQHRPA